MGNAGQLQHTVKPAPFQKETPAAGTVLHKNSGSAKACFNWDSFTPADSLHSSVPSLQTASKINEHTHGIRNGNGNGSAADVLSPPVQNPLLIEREQRRERHYHRKEHQILGRSSNVDGNLPDFTRGKDFRFGDVTVYGAGVGTIMYPQTVAAEDPEVYRRYVLSHGVYKPGESKKHYGKDFSPLPYRESVEHKRLENDGSRVHDALYWKDDRRRELEQKIITAELAAFHDRHQPEIGKVFDPMKSTLAHLASDHTFGIKEAESNSMHVSELMGTTTPHLAAKLKETMKWKFPCAGLKTYRQDDLDLQRHIIPVLGPQEDALLVRKITEDAVGGTGPVRIRTLPFGDAHVYGVPTVRDPVGRVGKVKRLADRTNYGDELGAKGLMYPTPRNVYGTEQLAYFQQKLQHLPCH